MKNKRIWIIISIIIIVAAATGYHFHYKSAVEAMTEIEGELSRHNYRWAYGMLNNFKQSYIINKFTTDAEEKMTDLMARADTEFKKGLGILENDSPTYFDATATFYDEFITTYPYSDNCKDAHEILNLIECYKNAHIELNDIAPLEDKLKSNKGAIETLEEYVNVAKGVHDFAYYEGSSGSDQATRNIYKFFANNKSYYNHIIAHLASVTPEGIENTLLTNDEFNTVRVFISSCMTPAEEIYWYYAKGRDVDFNGMENAWATSEMLDPQVTGLINEKKKYVLDYFNNLRFLRVGVDTYLEQIQSFPESYE